MKKYLLVLWVFLFVPTLSFATVIYEFSAFSDFQNGTYQTPKTFTLTSADYLVSDSSFVNGDPFFTTSDFDRVNMTVDAVAAGFTQTPSQAISAFSDAGRPVYYFDVGSFTTNGVHSSIILGPSQYATLTVSGGTPNAVPEPASAVLIGLGLLGIARVSRQQRYK